MTLKSLLAGTAVAAGLALGLAGVADATTYTLNTTDVGAFGPGPYGQVDVDVNAAGTSMTITLTLFDGNTVDTGTHHALTFDLLGTPTSEVFTPAIAGADLSFATFPGAYGNPGAPFTTNAAVDCGPCQGASGPPTPWTLTITGTGLGTGSNFAADQFSPLNGGSTGVVWTGQGGIVPEPASWALMIAGVGMTGAALRRRRQAVPA